MPRNDKTIVLEGAHIFKRNFAGKEGKYNREGDRNFLVIIDDELARRLQEDDWNVKWLKVREEGDVPQAFLQVSVNFKGRPPRIVLITSRGRTPIDEEMVETLDWVDIQNVDLILNPYEWEIGEKSGIKAYLQSMYITIFEDELELKYAQMEEVAE